MYLIFLKGPNICWTRVVTLIANWVYVVLKRERVIITAEKSLVSTAFFFFDGNKDFSMKKNNIKEVVVFLEHNMHLYQGSFSCFKCSNLSYFFFELEPELEDPEDWPRHLKSHKHHGKENGVSRLGYKEAGMHT